MHKTISRVILVCSISVSALLAAPPSDQNLLFHAPFNNCLDAETSAGTIPPKRAKGDLPIEESPMGPALLAGSAESQLMFLAKDNVSSSGGTVSFFISPRWTPNDRNLHQFFSLKADGRIDVYKHASSNRIVALIGVPNKSPDSYMLSAPLDKIEPGDSVHVALSWENGKATLFLNGDPVQTVENEQLTPPQMTEQSVFFIGDYYAKDYATPPASLSGNPDTFISDFKIYSQPRSEAEITQEAKSKTK